jgi:hypothetical protein
MCGRVRVYALVVLAVAAVATAALAPPDSGRGSDRRPGGLGRAPLVLPAEPHPAGRRRAPRTHHTNRPQLPTAEDLPAGTRPGSRARLAKRRIRRASEAFVAGLLRWEAAPDSASARRGIRSAATRQLAAFVLAAPPRLPSGAEEVERGRVDAVQVVRLEANRAVAQVTVWRPGAHDTVVLLELARRRGRWLATALR